MDGQFVLANAARLLLHLIKPTINFNSFPPDCGSAFLFFLFHTSGFIARFSFTSLVLGCEFPIFSFLLWRKRWMWRHGDPFQSWALCFWPAAPNKSNEHRIIEKITGSISYCEADGRLWNPTLRCARHVPPKKKTLRGFILTLLHFTSVYPFHLSYIFSLVQRHCSVPGWRSFIFSFFYFFFRISWL